MVSEIIPTLDRLKKEGKALLSAPGMKGYFADENFERLSRAEQLAEKYNVTVAQISMAWLFNQDLQVIPLLGGENAEMYRQNLNASEIKLTKEEVCQVVGFRFFIFSATALRPSENPDF